MSNSPAYPNIEQKLGKNEDSLANKNTAGNTVSVQPDVFTFVELKSNLPIVEESFVEQVRKFVEACSRRNDLKKLGISEDVPEPKTPTLPAFDAPTAVPKKRVIFDEKPRNGRLRFAPYLHVQRRLR